MSDWDEEIKAQGRPFWEALRKVLKDEPERVAYIDRVLRNFDAYEAMQVWKESL